MFIGKLTDPWFEAEFVGEAGEDGSFRHQEGALHGAQGLFLWCPCGFAEPGVPHAKRGTIATVFSSP